MTSGYLPSTVGAGELVAELAAVATATGANTGLWPGLTIYRFTAPVGPAWEESSRCRCASWLRAARL